MHKRSHETIRSALHFELPQPQNEVIKTVSFLQSICHDYL
jgi:hypothetical protein